MLTHKFTRAAAFAGAAAGAAFAVGLPSMAVAGTAAGVGLVASSEIGQRTLTNKFFVASGVATYALAAGFPVSGSGASLALAGLAFTIKHGLQMTAAGYGGLLIPRIARGLHSHERKKYKVLAKEAGGTAAGLAGFMGGSAVGLAYSGSPEVDMNVVKYKWDNEGLLPTVEEIRDQINEIMIQSTAALDNLIQGGRSIYDIFNRASNKVNQEWYEVAKEAAQIPEVAAAGTVVGCALGASIGSYLLVRNLIFRKKDYEPENKGPQTHENHI